MCEILFRGKRLHDGKWVEGCLVKAVGGECMILPITTEYYGGVAFSAGFRCDPATVGQYTGLTGKKIFEGDIVDGLFRFTTPLRAVCTFKDGAFGLAWTHGGVDHFSAFTSICNVEYEVVGNIYDNPEMLEQEVQ